MAEKVTYASVIQSRGFRFLWLNQVLVQLSYNTLNFALIIWVFKLMHSNLAVAALMLAIYLPAIIFGLFAGVFVDLADRRKIIILVDLLFAFSFLIFVFIKQSFPLILLNTFFANTLAQFFMPSESSSIPMLLKKNQLFMANSLFTLTLYTSMMVGFSMGGPLLNNFGINSVFLVAATLLFIAFIIAQNLPSLRAAHIDKKFENFTSLSNFQEMIRLTVYEVKQTVAFIKGKLEIAVAIALMASIQGIIGILAVTMPSFLENVLRIRATDASYFVMLPLGLGMVFGALFIGRFFHGKSKRSLVTPAILGGGVIILAIGFLPTIIHLFQAADLPTHLSRPRYFFRAPSISSLFALLAFLAGFCAVSIIVPCQTILQERTTIKNRGKIFAVLFVIMTAFSAVAAILAGGLSDIIGVTPIFVGLGIIVFLVGLLVWRPSFFFRKDHLPYGLCEFLGLGHWEK
jgi:MFS family permease